MQPNQLVNCVGGDLLYLQLLRHMPSVCPEQGLTYTIENVITDCPSCGQSHVTLRELAGPFINGYPARWFRPYSQEDFASFLSAHLPATGEVFEG